MKNLEVFDTLFPFNLQFFAESENNTDDVNTDDKNDNKDDDVDDDLDDEDEDSDDEDDDEKSKKKKSTSKKVVLSQTQLNRMMTKEKREGKKSILKALGFDSIDEAKKAGKLLTTLLDSQKTDKEKSADSEKARKAAEEKAMLAEFKLSCALHGVNKDSIDDVLAIAAGKVDEDTSIDDVLDEMMEQKRYKGFFSRVADDDDDDDDSKGKGTGRLPGNKRRSTASKNAEYGKQLATKRVSAGNPNGQKKSTYF